MTHKTLIDGTDYEIAGGNTLVGGTAYRISSGKTLVGGTSYNVQFGALTLGDLKVGSSVFLKVNGSFVEFLIVHQGNPNSDIYDGSCDGTWVLMKDIHEMRAWDNINNDYRLSDINTYLNRTFINLFDDAAKTLIKTAKIPYVHWFSTTSGYVVYKKENGLSSNVFLLSFLEVGESGQYGSPNGEGSRLSYFDDASKRIGYFDGEVAEWWLRSPNVNYTDRTYRVTKNGTASFDATELEHGIRPALILSSDGMVNRNLCVV